MNRRRFLWIAGTFVLAGCRPGGMVVPTVYVPGNVAPPPKPTEPPLAQTTVALPPIPTSVPITDQAKLYTKSFRLTPTVDSWQLRIDGLVDQPLTLSLDDIKALPAVESMRALECIGNGVGGGLIGNLVWAGVAADQLFRRAGVAYQHYTHVHFEAADCYTTAVERKWIEQPGVLLVYGANGQPLSAEHGYPLRILIPGLYGQKMPKWITRITFADTDKIGYWEGPAYEWSNIAAVRTNSQIVTREKKFTVGDSVRLMGIAYAGNRAISSVEVSAQKTGEAPAWTPATLVHPPNALAWTQWVYDWQPVVAGRYTLAVRATDDTGFTQTRPATGMMAGSYPDGTDAIHQVGVEVL